MVMVDELVRAEANLAVTRFTILQDNLFLISRRLGEPGLVENIAQVVNVIGEVTNQKEDGGGESRNHAISVGDLFFMAYEIKAEAQKYRAQAVQTGINDRQVGKTHPSCSNCFKAARICA